MLTHARTDAAARAGDVNFTELRAREFARLDAQAHTYLDYTGSALYPESLVAGHATVLRSAVLGNPHSDSPASGASTAIVAEARERVLRFFDADPADYAVVFTANASGAIRLVAEGYRFGARAPFVLAADDHNSVNGVREFAARAGAPVRYLPLDGELRLTDADERLRSYRGRSAGLFAFPAQSNFSGVRHPLGLVRSAQASGYRVLLDAAAYAPTSALSLRDVPADFVALSFYKMFGYPTGVGALIARHDALRTLRRPWFAGGTVDFVAVHAAGERGRATHLLREGAEAFEDGSANFLAIGAVGPGLDFLDSLGMAQVGRRAGMLAGSLADALGDLRRRDGGPLVRRYGPADGRDRGPTLAFNVLDSADGVVPYALVEQRARAARVSVRGGCFCNPGAAAAAFGFPVRRTTRCLAAARRDGWSLGRFGECMQGRAVGAVRASLGVPSNAADVARLVDVVASMA